MENASKALIIGGAMLIAILLVSLGIVMFNSSKGTTDEAKRASETMSISMFNSQFTKYCGEKINGSMVRDLINYTNSYNNSKNAGEPEVNITRSYKSNSRKILYCKC